jgi:hypothetical protein
LRESNETKTTLKKKPIPLTDGGNLSAPLVLPRIPKEYDQWFRAQVQEALDDPGEVSYTHEEVMAASQAIIDQKRLEKDLRECAKS